MHPTLPLITTLASSTQLAARRREDDPLRAPHVLMLRRSAVFGIAVVVVFLIVGSIGRDPWKADEPYCIGIVQNMLQYGQWLVPHVGATPFLEKPPLMFWTAAATASLFGWALPFIDAARLSVVVWMTVTLVALAWAARAMYGPHRTLLAVMLMLGAVGLWPHSHKLIPDVSQLTGATLALAALVGYTTKHLSARAAGLFAGTGVGIAFLSKGLLMPGVCAVLALTLPACDSRFRSREWLRVVAWAIFASLPWLLVWPALLYRDSPAMFAQWLWDNNLDRFLGIRHHGEEHPSRIADFATLAVLTCPTSMIAVAALVQRWRRAPSSIASDATTMALVLYAAIVIVTLEVSASLREVYFLPLYPAFALVAAGVEWPNRISSAFRAIALTMAAVAGTLLIAAWALLVRGRGDLLPTVLGRWLPLDYVLPWQPLAVVCAIVVVACWLVALRWHKHLHAATVWLAGAMLVWGLANTLLLSWLDTAKSYRNTFADLADRLPDGVRCVTTIGLGESERAMLLYYTGRMPRERGAPHANDCRVAVVMIKDNTVTVDDSRWKRFWVGSRLGDRHRQFAAYHLPSRD